MFFSLLNHAGHFDAVRLLVSSGASKEIRCNKDLRAEDYALKRGHSDIAGFLNGTQEEEEEEEEEEGEEAEEAERKRKEKYTYGELNKFQYNLFYF